MTIPVAYTIADPLYKDYLKLKKKAKTFIRYGYQNKGCFTMDAFCLECKNSFISNEMIVVYELYRKGNGFKITNNKLEISFSTRRAYFWDYIIKGVGFAKDLLRYGKPT